MGDVNEIKTKPCCTNRVAIASLAKVSLGSFGPEHSVSGRSSGSLEIFSTLHKLGQSLYSLFGNRKDGEMAIRWQLTGRGDRRWCCSETGILRLASPGRHK